MENANAIDLKSLGIGGGFAVIVIVQVLNFLKPIVVNRFPKMQKKKKSDVSEFAGYIQTHLTSIMGKTVDIVSEAKEDIAVIKQKGNDTHNKLGEVQTHIPMIAKEIERVMGSQCAAVVNELRIMNEKLGRMDCVRKNV